MPAPPPHLPLLAGVVDELHRSGVTHAICCPGSRNAPLLLALHAHPGITCISALDERAAGFLALGIAKQTGHPAVVCVTSGTAVSNLLPAATEAHEAGVPLLLLTADRPPELRDVGAGQTIDQLRALGAVSRWTVELDPGDGSAARERWARATTCRAVAATLGPARPGPVQLNVPLREPLTAPGPHAPLLDGRADGRPWLLAGSAAGADPGAVDALTLRCVGAARGVLVIGRSERARELAWLAPRLAELLGWPLIADPMSGARRGPQALASYDRLLADAGTASGLVPDLVLRLGDLPVSKPLRAWLSGPASDAEQVLLRPEAVWADPEGVASELVDGDPVAIARRLVTALASVRERSEDASGASDWMRSWQDAEAGLAAPPWAAQGVGAGAHDVRAEDGDAHLDVPRTSGVDGVRSSPRAARPAPGEPLTEQLVARVLGEDVSGDATLVVGASLPIRMLERWAPVRDDPPRVLSNRGANGIDGVVSTAFGALAASPVGARVVAYLGELTLLYDQGGLAQASADRPLQLLVIDNGGGRIFDRLPVAEHADPGAFAELMRTPQDRDLAKLAAFHGLEHLPVATVGELRDALVLPVDRPRLLHVRV